jgi:hypothetical protein
MPALKMVQPAVPPLSVMKITSVLSASPHWFSRLRSLPTFSSMFSIMP